MNNAPKDKNAWLWIPFLYFTQGIPYILVVTVSVIMYKRLGIGNAEIGLYTSWLYLPWVIKPLWSPIVDLNGTKRKWFLAMQLVIALAFLGIGLSLPSNSFFIITLAFFWMAPPLCARTYEANSCGRRFTVYRKPEDHAVALLLNINSVIWFKY